MSWFRLTQKHAQISPAKTKLEQQLPKFAEPPTLAAQDIRRLLMDHERHELNERFSEAVQHAMQWKQVAARLQEGAQEFSSTVDVHEVLGKHEDDPAALRVVDIKSLFRRWRHYMSTLEMIADAQRVWQIEQTNRR